MELLVEIPCAGASINRATDTLSSSDCVRDVFINKIKKEELCSLPHFIDGNTQFHYIKRNDIYFVATTKPETSPILVIEILTRLYHVCKDFCGTVSEDSLIHNSLLIMELLNEFIDFGYVQLSTTDKLQPHIQSNPVQAYFNRKPTQDFTSRVFGIETKAVPTHAADRPVVGSHKDLEKTKNELYVDVIEKMTAVISVDGTVSRIEVNGCIQVKNFLIGSPQIKVSLNEDIVVQGEGRLKAYGDNVQLDSCTFHECVQVDSKDRPCNLVINPSIGEFSLMTYSICGETSVTNPFQLVSSIQSIEHSRDVMVTLQLKNCVPVSVVNVKVKLPVSKSVSSLSQNLENPDQSAVLDSQDGVIIWSIKSMTRSSMSKANFRLISHSGVIKREDTGPVSLQFEISGYLSSGLKVKTVKIVNKEKTAPQKWLRYITISDSYLVKLV